MFWNVTVSTVYLYDCLLAESRLNSAVTIDNARSITVENCIFSLNNGALSLHLSINGPTYEVE